MFVAEKSATNFVDLHDWWMWPKETLTFLEAPQDFGIQLRLNRRRHFTDYYKK